MKRTLHDFGYLLRFFHVVPPVPPMMRSTFAVLTMTAGIALLSAPRDATGALTPVLLLQSFAVSSGFSLPARRGHYDLLLTRGSSRALIALAHWVSSAAPGLASWLVLALVEAIATGGASRSLMASGTLAALFLVSTLPWALTVALPRFSGGIGWLLVLVTCSTTFPHALGRWPVVSTRFDMVASGAWSFLVYPVGAVGQSLEAPQLMAVIPALFVSIFTMITAFRWIARRDIPLEAAQ